MLLTLAAAPAFAQESPDPPPPPANENAAADDSEPQVFTTIQGQVFDALGRGVENSTVEITKKADPSVTGKVQTDPYGDFTLKLTGEHPGSFTIKITRQGFVDHLAEINVEIDDLEPFIDVMLKGALSVAGEVREFLEDNPVAGTTVLLETMYRRDAATTDEAGRFEFKNLIPGSVQLTAEAEGYGKSKVRAKVGETESLVRIVLKPERILNLTVLNDKEQPVAGVAVEMAIESAQDYRNATTDAEGRVTFKQLPFETDTVLLRLTHADYVATGRYDRSVLFPEDQLELHETRRLMPAAVVKGKITAAVAGQALNGARIDIGEAPDYSSPYTFANVSGEFQIGSLRPGRTVLTVSVAGYAPELKTVTTVPGEPTIVNIALGAGRTITGLVRDSEGSPVAGAEVEAMKWRNYRTLRASAATDEQGRFTIFDAPKDEFKVSIYARDRSALIDQLISAERNDYEFTLGARSPGDASGSGALCSAKMSDPCPPLELRTLAGIEIGPETIKNKIVLLDFWATWCGPCMAELPTLKRIRDDFGKRDDFLLVSLSSDFDKAALERTIKDKQLEWHHVYGPDSGGDELSTAFGVRAIPCTILVGKDGKIIAVGLIGKPLRQKLDELLGDKTN
ncbi:MAG: carboxypeptidase regulatory-like domain-containing protein [Planctomycetes bacterium]|nr:carboxypeptidase regulatory-like domain-containing protein [Planctomycetota bacterium]